MARLGIDFGTTNTVVVLSDRGHFPVVHHRVSTAAGEIIEEVFPSVVWLDSRKGEWRFGLEADRRARREPESPWTFRIGSFKRALSTFTEGQTLRLSDGVEVSLEDLVVKYLGGLRESLLRSGFFPAGDLERLECVISWPANSNGAQRHVTRRAFQRAGFDVVGSINEPAASAVEYADRVVRGNRAEARDLRSAVAVFDLGGGTFDTSLVTIDGSRFHVVASSGIEQLAAMTSTPSSSPSSWTPCGSGPRSSGSFTRQALIRHARMGKKEGISRDPERGFLEITPADYGLKAARPGRPVRVLVDAYYEAIRPMIRRAVEVMEQVLHGEAARAEGLGPERVEAIYLAGGSSRLPLGPKLLSERFPGTRIVLSDKPFTSVAMAAGRRASGRACRTSSRGTSG